MVQEVATVRRQTIGTTLIDVKGLKVHFPIKGGILVAPSPMSKPLMALICLFGAARRLAWWAKAVVGNQRRAVQFCS